jgi:hypothetical protein
MAKEEVGLREYYEFLDLGKEEKPTLNKAITDAVDIGFKITESNIYRKAQVSNAKIRLEKAIEDRERRRKG